MHFQKFGSFCAGFVGLLLASVAPSTAATMKYEFISNVSSAHSSLSLPFAAGQSVTGHFVVEDTPQALSTRGSGTRTRYGIKEFAINIGGYVATSTSAAALDVYNNFGMGGTSLDVLDRWHVVVKNWDSAPNVNGFSVDKFLMVFQESGVAPLNTLTGPGFQEAIAAPLNFKNMKLLFDGGRAVTMTQPENAISAVPLPAALPMLALGLGAFGFIGRRRKKATS